MRTSILYAVLVGIPVLFVLKILQIGQNTMPAASGARGVSGAVHSSVLPSLPVLLIQIAVILLLSRLVGLLFRKIRQPQVMGEMLAGIMLGPSLFGWVFPQLSAQLFPTGSLGFLSALSQIGLIFYMFLVGLQLDTDKIRHNRHTAIVTSHASIIFPFALGVLLALFLYPRLTDHTAPFVQFALFLGTAMSITAFPVLARILTDTNTLRTRVGSIAIACAAVDDVTAWCILAGVVFLVRAGSAGIPIWATLAGSAVYTAVMVFGVRRALGRIEVVYRVRGEIPQDLLAVILILVVASAWTTELLGIHALFGAFIFGAITPKHQGFVNALSEKLGDFIVVLLLPLFFAFTGLRMSIGLVTGGTMWFYCGLIIVVAIVGKFAGSALSSRLSGLPWREAGAIGILMNTRGLMELVVLNIGLDVGAISPTVFSMMVLMALVTTFMTTPLLKWVYPIGLRSHKSAGAVHAASHIDAS